MTKKLNKIINPLYQFLYHFFSYKTLRNLNQDNYKTKCDYYNELLENLFATTLINSILLGILSLLALGLSELKSVLLMTNTENILLTKSASITTTSFVGINTATFLVIMSSFIISMALVNSLDKMNLIRLKHDRKGPKKYMYSSMSLFLIMIVPSLLLTKESLFSLSSLSIALAFVGSVASFLYFTSIFYPIFRLKYLKAKRRYCKRNPNYTPKYV